MLAVLAPVGLAHADKTRCADGELFPRNPDSNCDPDCPGQVGEVAVGKVFFEAYSPECDPDCLVYHRAAYSLNACTWPDVPEVKSLELHFDPHMGPCHPELGCDVEVGTGTDLLSQNPIRFEQAEWQNLLAGESYIVVGEIGPSDASEIWRRIVCCVNKHNPLDDDCNAVVPAIPEWGLLAMTVLLLIVGTVVLRRPRPVPA
jgi:hypothetical protein